MRPEEKEKKKERERFSLAGPNGDLPNDTIVVGLFCSLVGLF
jgi:hypothetical protein